MAKRIADKELTDRNWDQEDEGEEPGTFSLASEDVLKNRPIKKAKRRNMATEGEAGGAFKSFKGFSLASVGTGGGAASFGGLGNGTGFKTLPSLTNGNGGAVAPPALSTLGSTPTAKTTTGSLAFNGPASSQPPATDVSGRQPNGPAPGAAQSPQNSREYSRQLTALNYSVRDWITKHVNDNPLCDLNPIFRDYEQHLASIERQYGGGSEGEAAKQGSSQPTGAVAAASAPASSTGGSSGIASLPGATLLAQEKESVAPQIVPPGVTFNFGKKVDASLLGTLGTSGAASFSFSTQSSSASLFGGQGAVVTASSFSFGGAKAEAANSAERKDENGGADEESEEPPKPVVTEVKEDDAFYSKKCKLFYKKENEFKEKGVGTLHLKQVADGKTQLLVRADTNLGNILLNIMLPASMPCSRMGKNNVMVVCVPNPPVDEKSPTNPVPLLIRVKTGEDADELHRVLLEKRV
ncbi:nuclear pore complex protein Nup50 [Brienomyrus brachyistius]|uniref:nuclear pore complex protein Nup50 n=1 Tax=Brienomyrus brachyistius TaxID=42636 RepID=UPI0020B3B9CF|nr:nuclear pore complex protein Nup50 [Brienomyrus brachyistius]XP_048863341.1 nuclear pore complex protein Nup50 [Brienomyrus brachyistius]